MMEVVIRDGDGNKKHRRLRGLDAKSDGEVVAFRLEDREITSPKEFFKENQEVASLQFFAGDDRYTVVSA